MLIGDGLSIEGLKYHISPRIVRTFSNILKVKDRGRNTLLVSLINANGEIEKTLNKALLEASEQMEKDIRNIKKPISHPYQVKENGNGIYEIAEIYSGDRTAEEIFPSLAVKYISLNSQTEVKTLLRDLSDLTEKFRG